jgi:hypothetical protein
MNIIDISIHMVEGQGKLLFSVTVFFNKFCLIQNRNKSAKKGCKISAHRNINKISENLVSEDYTNIIYKKLKHTHNIYFRVLLWAIKLFLRVTKYVSCFPITRNVHFRMPILFLKKSIIHFLKRLDCTFTLRSCTKCKDFMHFHDVNFR